MKRISFILITVLLVTTTYTTAGLEDDLVFYFTFDNVKGKKILDEAGNNLDAKVVQNVNFVEGKYGNAIHIAAEPEDGDCVRIPEDNLLKIEGGITMMAWVHHEDWNTAWGSWLDKGSQIPIGRKTSYSIGFFGGIFKGPNIGMILGGGDLSWQFNTTGPMVDKHWHHIAGTYDGMTRRIYLDGKIPSNGKNNFEFMGTNNLDLRIGCAAGNPQYIFKNGSIDEVGLWRRALSQAEIKEAMKGFLAVSPRDKASTTWGDMKRRVGAD